ncbi:MAG: endonuclease/exonuclease/phosphatase family protein [Acidobacteriota bacterium]
MALSRRPPRRRRGMVAPHLALVRAPRPFCPARSLAGEFRAATYNVHRWTGLNGRRKPDPDRAREVIDELDVDLLALQEVLRPENGEDPLESLATAHGMHVAFAATRSHRFGQIGNAVLSRWPIVGATMCDLSFTRLEKRLSIGIQIRDGALEFDAVSTHLALSDRTRHRQVKALLDHPRLRDTPTLLLGDMNAWRRCRATRVLDRELTDHHNREWPASFPSTRPVLALDRIYGKGLRILEVFAHRSRTARRSSDHLPIVARVRLERASVSA